MTILMTLKDESELTVKWFKENNIIVNPDKFQAMVLQKQDRNSQISSLNIDNKIIETTKSVKLFAITTDSQLWLDEHISNLCNKSSMQLNVIKTISPLFGIFVHPNPTVKLRKFKNTA